MMQKNVLKNIKRNKNKKLKKKSI